MSSPLRAWKVVLLAVAAAAPALAFDFIVTEYTDDPLAQDPGCTVDHCTLREAVIAANTGADLDRILLSAGTYAVNLTGAAENLAAAGDLDLTQSVDLVGVGAGLTILDGTGLGENIVRASRAAAGGVFGFFALSVRGSDLNGLSLGSGTHTVEDCEFSDNGTANSHSGLATTISSTVTVRRSSFVANSGHGLSVTQGTATLENCTLSGNGNHELLVFLAVSFTCTHCTLFDPDDIGKEVQINDSTVSFANSIVAGECTFIGTGSVVSLGGNVESLGNTCNFGQATDLNTQLSVQLDLAALADNGGPTPTHLPGAVSVVNGNAVDALCPVDDQRGVVRETNCESGSVERTGVHVETPIFLDGFLQGDTEAWSATVPPP